MPDVLYFVYSIEEEVGTKKKNPIVSLENGIKQKPQSLQTLRTY